MCKLCWGAQDSHACHMLKSNCTTATIWLLLILILVIINIILLILNKIIYYLRATVKTNSLSWMRPQWTLKFSIKSFDVASFQMLNSNSEPLIKLKETRTISLGIQYLIIVTIMSLIWNRVEDHCIKL